MSVSEALKAVDAGSIGTVPGIVEGSTRRPLRGGAFLKPIFLGKLATDEMINLRILRPAC